MLLLPITYISICIIKIILYIYYILAIYVIYHKRNNETLTTPPQIENTSWKVLAYGIYARVVDVSEIERVSAANE